VFRVFFCEHSLLVVLGEFGPSADFHSFSFLFILTGLPTRLQRREKAFLKFFFRTPGNSGRAFVPASYQFVTFLIFLLMIDFFFLFPWGGDLTAIFENQLAGFPTFSWVVFSFYCASFFSRISSDGDA